MDRGEHDRCDRARLATGPESGSAPPAGTGHDRTAPPPPAQRPRPTGSPRSATRAGCRPSPAGPWPRRSDRRRPTRRIGQYRMREDDQLGGRRRARHPSGTSPGSILAPKSVPDPAALQPGIPRPARRSSPTRGRSWPGSATVQSGAGRGPHRCRRRRPPSPPIQTMASSWAPSSTRIGVGGGPANRAGRYGRELTWTGADPSSSLNGTGQTSTADGAGANITSRTSRCGLHNGAAGPILKGATNRRAVPLGTSVVWSCIRWPRQREYFGLRSWFPRNTTQRTGATPTATTPPRLDFMSKQGPTPPPTPPGRNQKLPGRSESGWPRWSAWIVVGILIALLGLANALNTDSSEEIAYSDFLEEVQRRQCRIDHLRQHDRQDRRHPNQRRRVPDHRLQPLPRRRPRPPQREERGDHAGHAHQQLLRQPPPPLPPVPDHHRILLVDGSPSAVADGRDHVDREEQGEDVLLRAARAPASTTSPGTHR